MMEINNNNKSMDNTNNMVNSGQPPSPIIPPDKEKISSVLKILTLISLGIFLGSISFKIPYRATNQSNTILTTVPTQEKKVQASKTYKLAEIFTPQEKIISSQIAPNNTYAFVLTQKSSPIRTTFKENEKGPVILMMGNLSFVNLDTKEKRGFNLYYLASKEILEPLKTIPVQTQYTLQITPLKWSADSKHFWGAINLVSSADPPVNDSVSLFKINTPDLTVERYPLPGNYINTLGQQNLNLDKKAVLFESATPENELYLYYYNIITKNKTTIVSYPNSIFSKYLPGENGFLGYYYPQFTETESRQLNAKWVDKDTVSYVDFVTRQEVTKKIE